MPDNKRLPVPEESYCPLLFLADEDKSASKPLLREDGARLDGRKPNEIRPLYLSTDVNPHATGSAYLEMGTTKVLCTIYGPKEVPRREDIGAEGKVVCEFKFAPFSCVQRRQHQQDQEEKGYSSLVAQAVQRVIRVETFPKLQLEISILVVENGGSALAASITCAGLALASSGMEILDVPTACIVVKHESGFLADPSLEEEYMGDVVMRHPSISGSVMAVYLPSLDEVTGVKQTGVVTGKEIREGLELCVEGCTRIHHRLREHLTDHVTKHAVT